MPYIEKDLKPGYSGKFVIQNHFATHHHWDFRLSFPVSSVAEALGEYGKKRPAGKSPEPAGEKNDKKGTVLRSWALPKYKLPTDKPVLATETENHAIEYGSFEGQIPEDEYGAGKVTIHDKGNYELLDVDYDKKYVFTLHGKKEHGTYALIKTHGRQFLLTRVKDTSKYKMSYFIRRLAYHIKACATD